MRQDSRQYSTNKEASSKFAVADIDEGLVCTSYIDLEVKEQATTGGKNTETDFDLYIAGKGGQ